MLLNNDDLINIRGMGSESISSLVAFVIGFGSFMLGIISGLSKGWCKS